MKASDPQHARLHADQCDFNADEYEQYNVHSVYESIALHFSNTRYKPWPLIPSFLNSFPAGSVGADLGCGNGKYLSLRSVVAGKVMQDGIVAGNDILTLGLDRSAKLVDLARDNIVVGDRVDVRSNRNEVVVGDAIRSSYRSQSLDFALSIATIHHFSTPQRRVQAVQELMRIVCPISQKQYFNIQKQQLLATKGASTAADYAQIAQRTTGRFLIYVWALEQRGESRRKFEDVAGQAEEGGKGRDLLVPWVLKTTEQKGTEETPEEEKVFQRYYHVFERGELEALVQEAAAQMPAIKVHLEVSGWEKGNWYGIWQCVHR